MSGPKYSTAEIEARRLQRLMKELEENIERSKVELLTKQIQSELRALERTQAQFRASSAWRESLSLADQYIPDSPDVLTLKRLTKEIEQFKAVKSAGRTSSELAQRLAEIQRQHTQLRGRIALVDTLLAPVEKEVEEIIQTGKENEFLNKQYGRESISKSRKAGRTTQLYYQLLELLTATDRITETKPEIDAIVSNPNVDDTFKQRQLQMRIDAISAVGDDRDEIAELQARAMSLAKLIGRYAIELPNTVYDLQILVKELEEEAKQKAADEYIETSIRKVLEEVGYAVVDTQTVRTKNKTTRKQIASVSGHSILQVASSDTGAVMFEIMSRKAPEDITDADRHAVVSDMRAFCPDYRIIRQKLAERGITLTGEILCEPGEQYVRGSNYGSTTQSTRRKQVGGLQYHVDD